MSPEDLCQQGMDIFMSLHVKINIKNIQKMIFQKIKKLFYFIYYCNFRIMDSIADRYMKNSPIHGWSWPMFVSILNLGTINQLFNSFIFRDKNINYILGIYFGIAIFNFLVFTYKNRHTKIIEECLQLPYRTRRFGVVFFAIYSIVSFIALFVVIFGDIHL